MRQKHCPGGDSNPRPGAWIFSGQPLSWWSVYVRIENITLDIVNIWNLTYRQAHSNRAQHLANYWAQTGDRVGRGRRWPMEGAVAAVSGWEGWCGRVLWRGLVWWGPAKRPGAAVTCKGGWGDGDQWRRLGRQWPMEWSAAVVTCGGLWGGGEQRRGMGWRWLRRGLQDRH
jgi:hypothetical protein